jgi:hypothetical protein
MKRKNYVLWILVGMTFILFECQKSSAIIDINNNNNNNEDSIPKTDTSIFTVTGAGDKGEILLAVNTKTKGVLLILDEKGNVIKEKTTDVKVENFQKWNINGQTQYSYFQTDGDYAIAGTATEEGYDIICDSNLNELYRAKFIVPANDDSSWDKLDVHDFILLGDHHYMAISCQRQSPKNIPANLYPAKDAEVIACIIQEVKDGQVLFQWNGTDYPEFYGSSVENNHFTDSNKVMDYMHMNSISIDPNDGNIICSFRNLDQIIKIDRTSGDIIWRLGGKNSDFALTDDEVFLRQHFARIIDDNHTLLFLDNGEQDIRPYSRIVEFQLDENAKKITGFKAYKIPDEFIQYAGSVQKSNGHYFIGGASAKYSIDVDYTTNEVFLRLNQKYTSYRSLKYE